MLEIKKYEVLMDAICTYGIESQVNMAIEEMSELTKALCKNRRTPLNSVEREKAHANVIEEIADVAIMLKQLILIFDRGSETQEKVDYKINRLEKRLNEAHWKELGEMGTE